MGQNPNDGGRSPGFIESSVNAITSFYANVLEQVVPWTARPPQARPATRAAEYGIYAFTWRFGSERGVGV
jgi:hypothetical protein